MAVGEVDKSWGVLRGLLFVICARWIVIAWMIACGYGGGGEACRRWGWMIGGFGR